MCCVVRGVLSDAVCVTWWVWVVGIVVYACYAVYMMCTCLTCGMFVMRGVLRVVCVFHVLYFSCVVCVSLAVCGIVFDVVGLCNVLYM